MKHVAQFFAAVAVVLVLLQIGIQAECITIGPPGVESPPQPKSKPLRVSGAFCGKAVAGAALQSGAEVSLENVDLELIDADTSAKVGNIHVDSRGDFRLPRVPAGKYRVRLAGFT